MNASSAAWAAAVCAPTSNGRRGSLSARCSNGRDFRRESCLRTWTSVSVDAGDRGLREPPTCVGGRGGRTMYPMYLADYELDVDLDLWIYGSDDLPHHV